jgi:hypothetical protein
MKKILFSLVFMTIISGTPGLRGQSVYSDFTANNDGWMIVGSQSNYQPVFYSTGGNPGGYICEDNNADPGIWYFKAPSKYYGDRSGAYNRTLSFDLMLTDTTSQIEDVDVSITGAGITLVINLPHDTTDGWQHFLTLLNENSGWHIGTLTGQAPSYQDFINVLTNLTQIEIRGKFTNASGSGCLDNVYLAASSPVSTFDTDYEGWRVIGDAQGGSGMPNYHSTGGNPGGYLSAVDDAVGGTWYWQAPGKFLGDKSGTYGQYLRFDLKQSDLINQFDNYDIIMQGPSYNLVFNTPNNPDTSWTSYSILMSETAGWRINDTLGDVPSQQQFQSVLSNLQNLYIRGEFIVGDDSGCIDNVKLGLVSEILEHELSPGQLAVFPNPAKEYIQLSMYVEQDGFYDFSLTGVSGERGVLQHRFYLSKGKQLLKVSLGNVLSGSYIAEMRNGSTVFRRKVVVK